MPPKYHALAKGSVTGIFGTWEECMPYLNTPSAPRYKTFDDFNDALAFLAEQNGKKLVDNDIKSPTASPWKTKSSTESPIGMSPCRPSTSSACTPSSSSLVQSTELLVTKLDVLKSTVDGASRTFQQTMKSCVAEMEKVTSELSALKNELSENKDSNSVKSPPKTSVSRNLMEDLELAEEFNAPFVTVAPFAKLPTASAASMSPVQTRSVHTSSQSCDREERQSYFGIDWNKITQKANKKRNADNADIVKRTPTKIPRCDIADDLLELFNYDNDYVCVYTDGACENNGQKGAKAGIGIWFGDGNPFNISAPLSPDLRRTNNVAEIEAARHAIVQAKRAGISRLAIYTDSEFLINCMTQWIKKWKRNSWKTAGGQPVKNKENIVALDSEMIGMQIRWESVRAHVGIHGNEQADRLAKQGAENDK